MSSLINTEGLLKLQVVVGLGSVGAHASLEDVAPTQHSHDIITTLDIVRHRDTVADTWHGGINVTLDNNMA